MNGVQHERHFGYTLGDGLDEHPIIAFRCSLGVVSDIMNTKRRRHAQSEHFDARIGYARVSTSDQNLDAQIAALEAADCTMIRTQTGSGTPSRTGPNSGSSSTSSIRARHWWSRASTVWRAQ